MSENRAHPRSRGENFHFGVPFGVCVGSSPLTRGKHVHVVAALEFGGLIPAHAGKTLQRRNCVGCTAAHPRSRGENSC